MPSACAPSSSRRLVDPGRLRPPGAAIGVDRHGVGVDAAHPQMQVRRAIKPGDGLRIGIAGNARREIAEIAAERRERVDLQRDDAAVAVEAHARARDVVARLRIGDQRFRARGGPFHGTPEPPRGPHDGRHLDREIALEPEAATDVRRHHADFVLGDVQRVEREPAPQVMRHLRGGVERREIGRRVVVAEIGARLHRAAGEPLVR